MEELEQIVCPECGREKPEKPKLGRLNDPAVIVRCECGCRYSVRRVFVPMTEIRVVE
jgi:hypothetical protein